MAFSGMSSFWRNAGKQLGITKDQHEDDYQFCCRVMLSALSKWALISVSGQSGSVSVERLKQILSEKTLSYVKLLPPIHPINTDALAETIYQTLLDNGCYYHFQYNVRPAPYKLIDCGDVSFVRGLLPEEHAFFSGMAPFINEQNTENALIDSFMLWPHAGETTLKLVWKRSARVGHDIHLDEYLNIGRTRGQYYISSRDMHWPFSLARTKQTGNAYSFDYYLISGDEIRHIPSDYLDISIQDYVRLAMMNRAKPQAVNYWESNQTVSIEFSYILPAPDLRFIRYVSWPWDIDDLSNSFRFKLHPAIWPSIKNRLESLGYEVKGTND